MLIELPDGDAMTRSDTPGGAGERPCDGGAPCTFPRCGCGIRGRCVGSQPADEAEHFYRCQACGQAVDMRDLGQVFHHEESDHERICSHA